MTRLPSAEAAEGQGGRDCCLCGLPALVLAGVPEPRPGQCLTLVVAREEAEADSFFGVEGDPGVEGHPGEAVRGCLADVLEVRGAATDHDPERDDGLMAAGEGSRGEGQLEGTGDADHRRLGNPQRGWGPQSPLEQPLGPRRVPPRTRHTYAE